MSIQEPPPIAADPIRPPAKGKTDGTALRLWSILTSLTSGGAEMFVTSLHGAFARQGVSAGTIALCDAPALGNSGEMEARLAERLTAGGSTFLSLGLSADRGLFEGARAMRRALRKDRPDVIHAHTARALGMLALAGWRGPLVLTHHNSRLSFSPRMFHLFDLAVDAYVAISADVAGHYRAHSRRPFSLIPNAPAPEFTAQGPRRTRGTPLLVLSVGAISEQKNYDHLLAAANALRLSNGPPVRFEIAGGGPGLDAMRARVCEQGLEDSVFFLGERSDVGALMARADVFLNTSHYEGMPIAVLESLAMALPVVATDVPGNRDLVEPYRNGFLCAPAKPGEIADALCRIAAQDGLHARLSAGALASSRKYTLDAAAGRHLRLYRDLIGVSCGHMAQEGPDAHPPALAGTPVGQGRDVQTD